MNKETQLDNFLLKEILQKGQWISKNSSILVFHGIGYQKPFDTLDIFVRGILDTYIKIGFKKTKFSLTHRVEKIDDKSSVYFYRNSVRIEYDESNFYLDCYEFYWADETENKVSWGDTQNWIRVISDGANNFYDSIKKRGELKRENSLFFTNGVFHNIRYKFIMKLVAGFMPVVGAILGQIMTLLRYIPFVEDLIRIFLKTNDHKLTNLFGDIVAYNSPDPKNKLFEVRQRIKEKAYKSIEYLLEAKNKSSEPMYDNIVIVAHSLGTQIAFDALNETEHALSLKNIKRDNADSIISGFVTFGSHLDKAAFFFFEQIDKEAYIKEQIRKNFYSFKKENSKDNYPIKLKSMLSSSLNSIKWRNYYDANDPVSGHLDYYNGVENIDCNFTKREKSKKRGFLFYISHLYPFTHGRYWNDNNMYTDIIVHYLNELEES
jgi:hypothetical protein